MSHGLPPKWPSTDDELRALKELPYLKYMSGPVSMRGIEDDDVFLFRDEDGLWGVEYNEKDGFFKVKINL